MRLSLPVLWTRYLILSFTELNHEYSASDGDNTAGARAKCIQHILGRRPKK